MTTLTPPAASATASHCPYCALQCAMTLTRVDAAAGDAGGVGSPPLEIQGRDFPTNRGGLCKKGWTAAEVLVAPDRLRTPLVRGADGELRPASWEEALDLIAGTLAALRAQHGADAVAVFGGGGLTNEKAYQLGKFARLALGTSRIDYNGRFCMSSAAAAGNRAFGIDRGLPFPLEHLDAASTILLLGTNVAATMPPFVGHLAGAQAAGGLVVVDPRRTATARLTDDGRGIHVQPSPGTDLALLLGITHVVLAEGLADERYIADRTTGVEALRRSVAGWWPERVQSVTGVPVVTIRRIARRLAAGRRCLHPHRTRGRAARRRHRHGDGGHQPRPRPRAARAARTRATARSPARATARAVASTDRNATSCRDTARSPIPRRAPTSPGCGASTPESIPGPGVPAVELLASLGTPEGPRAMLVHGSNLVVSAPERRGGAHRAREARPAGRVGLLPLRDGRAGGCRASR